MKLRIYIGVILATLTFMFFCFLAFENHKRSQEIQLLRTIIQEQERKIVPILPPLPVCHKGQVHAGCRPLAADETGAIVRGVRDEIQND